MPIYSHYLLSKLQFVSNFDNSGTYNPAKQLLNCKKGNNTLQKQHLILKKITKLKKQADCVILEQNLEIKLPNLIIKEYILFIFQLYLNKSTSLLYSGVGFFRIGLHFGLKKQYFVYYFRIWCYLGGINSQLWCSFAQNSCIFVRFCWCLFNRSS